MSGNFSWIYEGQKLHIDLNTDGLSGLSDYTVKWDVERADDEQESGDAVECVAGGQDNATYIELEGIEGYARVVASVYVSDMTEADGPIAEKELFIEVRKPVYDYHYPWSEPGENQMILYGDTFVDPWMWVWVEDSENPYGEERQTKIESVEITGQYTWNEEQEDWTVTEDQIMVLEGDENEGWYLRGDHFGKVDLKITYESVNVENQSEEYYTEFYVNGDLFALNWDYLNGTDQMLRNSEMTIDNISMWHDYLNEEEGVESEEIQGFSLSVTDDGNAAYDDGLIDVQVGTDHRSIKITSKNEEGETDIFLRGMLNGEEVCCVRIHINVTNSYCNLTLVSVENVGLGKTLNLSTIDWQLWSYDVDENGNNQQSQLAIGGENNFRVRLADYGYDENAWEIQSDIDPLLPTLTRKGNWDTDVQVIAEERMYNESGTPRSNTFCRTSVGKLGDAKCSDCVCTGETSAYL